MYLTSSDYGWFPTKKQQPAAGLASSELHARDMWPAKDDKMYSYETYRLEREWKS
jgi:hypothetical protein